MKPRRRPCRRAPWADRRACSPGGGGVAWDAWRPPWLALLRLGVQAAGRFQHGLDLSHEPRRVVSVHDAMIDGDRQVHEIPDLDLVADDRGALLDLMNA